MTKRLRSVARRLLGVARTPTYYLPWLTRPGIECALLINNIESRFTTGRDSRDLAATVTQHDADGRVVRTWAVTLADSADAREVRLEPTAGGVGLVTVTAPRVHSDLYVTLADGETYTATHGRHEFIERYPARTRVVMTALGALLAAAGRTIPAFGRDQYVYTGGDSRSHLLLMNLSDVVNRVRVAAARAGLSGPRTFLSSCLVTLPPLGSTLLDVASLAPAPAGDPGVLRLRLTGNAWFNLYLVGAGPRDLAGPLSLMHVK